MTIRGNLQKGMCAAELCVNQTNRSLHYIITLRKINLRMNFHSQNSSGFCRSSFRSIMLTIQEDPNAYQIVNQDRADWEALITQLINKLADQLNLPRE